MASSRPTPLPSEREQTIASTPLGYTGMQQKIAADCWQNNFIQQYHIKEINQQNLITINACHEFRVYSL